MANGHTPVRKVEVIAEQDWEFRRERRVSE